MGDSSLQVFYVTNKINNVHGKDDSFNREGEQWSRKKWKGRELYFMSCVIAVNR